MTPDLLGVLGAAGGEDLLGVLRPANCLIFAPRNWRHCWALALAISLEPLLCSLPNNWRTVSTVDCRLLYSPFYLFRH